MYTGSLPACGLAPCAPMPGTTMSTESDDEYWMPSDADTVPASPSESEWKASAYWGLGKRV